MSGSTQALPSKARPNPVVRFAVFHDVHGGHDAGGADHRANDLFHLIAIDNPEWVFGNGDLLDHGTETDPQHVTNIRFALSQLNCPRYFGFGNHDNGSGDSLTDCTPTNVAAFFDAVQDSHTPTATDDSKTLGYYHFSRDGIDYIVLNSVELQSPTEGDYGMRAEQQTWLTNTLDSIQGSDKRLVVFSHVDPSYSGSIWYRMATASRTHVQSELEDWVATSGGKLLGVLSGHEHGANNSDQNRKQTINGVTYINLVDGRRSDGASHVKALDYESNAVACYWLVTIDDDTITLSGQNGGGNVQHTVPAPLEYELFNGSTDLFDTDISPNASTVLTIVGKQRTAGTEFKVHGCSHGSGNGRFYLGKNTGNWCFGYETYHDTGVPADLLEHTFELSVAGLKIDGVLYPTTETLTFGTTKTINIGAHENIGSTNGFSDFAVKSVSIFHNSVTTTFPIPLLS